MDRDINDWMDWIYDNSVPEVAAELMWKENRIATLQAELADQKEKYTSLYEIAMNDSLAFQKELAECKAQLAYREEGSGPCSVCQTETTFSGYSGWLCPDHGGKP